MTALDNRSRVTLNVLHVKPIGIRDYHAVLINTWITIQYPHQNRNTCITHID